jgi:hypothetical protein
MSAMTLGVGPTNQEKKEERTPALRVVLARPGTHTPVRGLATC